LPISYGAGHRIFRSGVSDSYPGFFVIVCGGYEDKCCSAPNDFAYNYHLRVVSRVFYLIHNKPIGSQQLDTALSMPSELLSFYDSEPVHIVVCGGSALIIGFNDVIKRIIQ